MTNVDIHINDDEYLVKLEGHAGYNPGNDIVCAAISQMICTYAALVNEQGESIEIQEMYLDIAEVRIKFKVKSSKEYIAAITKFIIKGFRMLQEQYSEHIQCQLEINKKM